MSSRSRFSFKKSARPFNNKTFKERDFDAYSEYYARNRRRVLSVKMDVMDGDEDSSPVSYNGSAGYDLHSEDFNSK